MNSRSLRSILRAPQQAGLRSRGLILSASILTLLALGAKTEAQTAQLAGRVTDATSAPLAEAAVTVTRLETGTQRALATNAEGYYSVPFLPPGSYSLAVRLAGFRPAVREPVALSVGQAVHVDFVLEMERLTEEVRVEASVPLLEVVSSSIGHVIDGSTMRTLPLNGRNYTHLALLTPGSVANPGTRARADGLNLNGGRTFQNSFLIDGVDNNNYLFGSGGTGSTQAIRPSLEAVQEFRVESASYGAELGHAGGGVISVVTKSGTNTLHGTAFEFFRHDALEAKDYFAKRAGVASPPLRYNQFGATLGGPILRNRAFFFASYQGTREQRTFTATATVPTPEMVQGRFGDVTIYDPLNRQPFLNNTIPRERLDPVGQRIAALYPPPNRPGTVNNFVGNVQRTDDRDQIDLRLDYHPDDAAHLFLRYSRGDSRIEQGSLFGPPGNGHPGVAALGERQQFPLINDTKASSLAFGHTHVFSGPLVSEFRAGYTRNAADQRTPADRPLFDDFGLKGIPVFQGLNGLPAFEVAGFGMLGDRTALPFGPTVRIAQLSENLSWLLGTHNLKFGAEVRLRKNTTNSANQARGEFTFNGQFTGSGLADLLLGQTSFAQLSTPLQGDFRDHYYALYVNDTWELSRALTFNLGLRYELQTPMWEAENRMANFDLNPDSPTFGTLVPARGGSLRSRTFTSLDTDNLAPRLGFALQLAPRTALRGAYGIFYAAQGYQEPRLSGASNLPYFVRVGSRSPAGAARSSLVLGNGFPEDALDPSKARNPDAATVLRELPTGETYQWSLGLQQQLWAHTVLSASYVGSRSLHLRAFNNVNAPVPGEGSLNSRRPFPSYGEILETSDFGEASYHALQVKAERRVSSGFSLLAAYTWAHAIDNFTDPGDTPAVIVPQNLNDIGAEKASANVDVRHRFVASFAYGLPFGRRKAPHEGSSLLRALLGGWKLAGIFVAQTGFPFTPTLSSNLAATTTPIRPNCLYDGSLPAGQRTADRWFDPSAYERPARFTYGNCGRHVLRAPGFVNLDLLVAREFSLGAEERLELRVEIFNLTNAVHLGRPNAVIDLPEQAGHITSTQAPARQVQLGLRLVF